MEKAWTSMEYLKIRYILRRNTDRLGTTTSVWKKTEERQYFTAFYYYIVDHCVKTKVHKFPPKKIKIDSAFLVLCPFVLCVCRFVSKFFWHFVLFRSPEYPIFEKTFSVHDFHRFYSFWSANTPQIRVSYFCFNIPHQGGIRSHDPKFCAGGDVTVGPRRQFWF
jgi:hypothetical protein